MGSSCENFRQRKNCLVFIMGISILVRLYIYTETVPRGKLKCVCVCAGRGRVCACVYLCVGVGWVCVSTKPCVFHVIYGMERHIIGQSNDNLISYGHWAINKHVCLLHHMLLPKQKQKKHQQHTITLLNNILKYMYFHPKERCSK